VTFLNAGPADDQGGTESAWLVYNRMMRSVRARISILIAVSLAAAVAAVPAQAAAPRYILVSGPGLQRPATLGNWSENLAFVTSLLHARKPLPRWRDNRPRYQLALFWGVPAKPVPTEPSAANQYGWFYPATGGRRAVVKLRVSGQDFPRLATAETLRILALHGVPTRVGR
jgi:hypothetical protein